VSPHITTPISFNCHRCARLWMPGQAEGARRRMLSNSGPIDVEDPCLQLFTPSDLFPVERQPEGVDGNPGARISNNTGTAEVTLAVVDTGCDVLHPDLSLNIWNNPCEQFMYVRRSSGFKRMQPYYCTVCVQCMYEGSVSKGAHARGSCQMKCLQHRHQIPCAVSGL
jgi:subtilisin family serine protease